MKKYCIIHNSIDDSYWIVDRPNECLNELKVYESDSLNDCFIWFVDKSFEEDGLNLKPNLDLHEEIWCVYWSDFNENYYICPDKEDGTLDDVCFRGSEKECNEFFDKHYITREENYPMDDSIYPCDYE